MTNKIDIRSASQLLAIEYNYWAPTARFTKPKRQTERDRKWLSIVQVLSFTSDIHKRYVGEPFILLKKVSAIWQRELQACTAMDLWTTGYAISLP